ncbi:MAG: mechanosensitive ion channel family protein [Geminicoccaceae bacterium]|nr:mechanosensitive ion channel family protein [Geminicoccaceae bacterium]
MLFLVLAFGPALSFGPVPPFGSSAGALAQEPPPGELESLITTLEDPAARDALIARLKALQAPAGKPPLDEASLVGSALDALQTRQAAVEEVVVEGLASWRKLPQLLRWMAAELGNHERRLFWLDVTLRLGSVFAVGFVLRALARRSAVPAVPRLTRSVGLRTLLAGLAGTTIFTVATLAMLLLLHQPPAAERAGLQLVAGIVALLSYSAVVRACLIPGGFLGVAGEEAVVLERGLLLAGRVGLIGHFVLEAARPLGLPSAIHIFFQQLLYFAVAVGLCILVFRLRRWVTDAILAWGAGGDGLMMRLLPLRFLARTWHWWTAGLILVHYLVWALRVPGGFVFLLQATLLTDLILVLAYWSLSWIDAVFRGPPVVLSEFGERAPIVSERATFYANPLRLLLRAAIVGAAVLLLIAHIWRTGLVDWLTSPDGMVLVGQLTRLAAIAVGAILLAEAISILVGRFLAATDEEGRPQHSNRSRTLADILRNFAIVLIVATAAMVMLAELGVDAAALFAGAGVVGLAIGFGSQRLVQDLITGLFILLGDTVRVGDVVEVGGRIGVVEGMSMRTVTLRSYDGNVHTVPYSTIDIVTNLTKDFSFAVLDIRVAYRENVDHVMEVMREIDARLRREWPYRRQILEPLEIAGVDQLADFGVVIRARSKTRPGEQWAIRRELSRRIKMRFGELGIEIPFPQQTLHFDRSERRDEALETLSRSRDDEDGIVRPALEPRRRKGAPS